MGKVPLPILKELEHQARQNISTLNFTAAFAKTSSSCNATLEKCQYSLKLTFKKVKSQIQKGADHEKAAKHGYEQACEYLDIWNKSVLIQHRALTCLSKSLAHILQRELYTMDSLLPWTETISVHLDWWQNPTNVMRGTDLHSKDHSIQLFTDASNEGWGIRLDQSSTKGL